MRGMMRYDLEQVHESKLNYEVERHVKDGWKLHSLYSYTAHGIR